MDLALFMEDLRSPLQTALLLLPAITGTIFRWPLMLRSHLPKRCMLTMCLQPRPQKITMEEALASILFQLQIKMVTGLLFLKEPVSEQGKAWCKLIQKKYFQSNTTVMGKCLLLVCCFCILLVQKLVSQTFQPPLTQKGTKIFKEHGTARTDDYFWLNNPSDSNVINHLKEENLYVDAYMKHTEGLQKKIYDEIVARILGKYESRPVKKDWFWYYSRFEEGKQYPYYARKKDPIPAAEEIILDVPSLSQNHQIYLVRGWSVSVDNQQLAYGIDTSGDRRSTLYFKNLPGGVVSGLSISNTSGNFVWANDNKTIYYVLNDHTVRPYKVMRHTLGTDQNADLEIYTEGDSTYDVQLTKSKN